LEGVKRRAKFLILVALLSSPGCRTGLNYAGAHGPRYAGGATPLLLAARRPPNALHVVTFNIQFARHIDRAIALFDSTPALRDADIVTLQEMDAPGTRRLASALGMRYVYYPATVHPKTGRDFGNAILSRWPILADAKVILPHLARFEKTERIATAATIRVGERTIRVYSVHLATWLGLGPGARRDQAEAVLADAAAFPCVIVAGDMNAHSIGKTFRAAGYGWPTKDNPATDHFFHYDHVFLKGLQAAKGVNTGVVRDNRGASDHRPVWAVVSLRVPVPAERMPLSAQP
jgi:endonuclease/exonuclease/phosphatase family metal-dependent hydrolase